MGIYSIIMDSNEKSHGSSHDGVTARDSLYSCIENGDTEHIENEFQNFRHYFLDFIRRDMSSYQLTINYLLAQLEIVAERGGVSLQQCSSLQENYYQRIKEADTQEDAINIFRDQCVELTNIIHECKQYSTLTRGCCSYIRTHIFEDISLSDLSSKLGYSESHISHKFKEDTGCTLNKYIRETKIVQAQKLLREGKSISECAALLCFSSQSHFTAAFKECTGLTPSAYLKGSQNNTKVMTAEL